MAKTNTWINMDWATCANIIYPSKKAQHPRALLFFPDRFLFPTTTARLPNSSTQTFCRLESPIRHSEWPPARKTLASRPSRSTSPARCVSSCPEHVLADVRPLLPFDTARLGSFFSNRSCVLLVCRAKRAREVRWRQHGQIHDRPRPDKDELLR